MTETPHQDDPAELVKVRLPVYAGDARLSASPAQPAASPEATLVPVPVGDGTPIGVTGPDQWVSRVHSVVASADVALASPLTLRLGRVQTDTTSEPGVDEGIWWEVSVGLLHPIGQPDVIRPGLVVRPCVDVPIDAAAVAAAFQAWREALGERRTVSAAEAGRLLPSPTEIFPTLAPGVPLRQPTALGVVRAERNQPMRDFIERLSSRSDDRAELDLAAKGGAADLEIEVPNDARARPESLGRQRHALAEPAILDAPVRLEPAQPIDAWTRPAGSGALPEMAARTDALAVLRARIARFRRGGGRPRSTLLPELASVLLDALPDQRKLSRAKDLEAWRAVLGSPTTFFAAHLAGAYGLNAATWPRATLPPEVRRQRQQTPLGAERDARQLSTGMLATLRAVPGRVRKSREQLEHDARRGRVRDRLVGAYLLPDTRALARPFQPDTIVRWPEDGEFDPRRLTAGEPAVQRTLRLLAEAVSLPHLDEMLALVADDASASWHMGATHTPTLTGFFAERQNAVLMVRVTVAPDDPQYRLALAATPDARPGEPMVTVAAGMVSADAARFLTRRRRMTPRTAERVRQEAEAIRDRQVAPGAGSVEVLGAVPTSAEPLGWAVAEVVEMWSE